VDFGIDEVYDADFCGIDADAPMVCRVHKKKPRKCVAFGGANTGRRYYTCSVDNVS
jgi:hypothetical protein